MKPYKILQVDRDAEQEVIEAAYKRLAGKYHPDKDIFIRQADLGRFLTGDWNQIAGVVILDLSRTADFDLSGDEVRVINMTTYPCTVLLNPKAEHPANPDWFPRATVAVFESGRFRWIRGEPGIRHGLPTGTRIAPQSIA